MTTPAHMTHPGQPLAPDERLLRSALQIVQAGMPVFPLQPRSTVPAQGLIDWRGKATRDPETVRRWWAMAPFNIGVSTGARTGHGDVSVLVIELEAPAAMDRPHGRQVLAELARSVGASLPIRTRTVHTPSGGQHLYFHIEDPRMPNTDRYLGPGINSRARGGYVVGPGSVVPEGRYELVDTAPPQPLPGWIDTWLRSGTQSQRGTRSPMTATHRPVAASAGRPDRRVTSPRDGRTATPRPTIRTAGEISR